MAELRIRTARHTVKVAAPARRVYPLIANVDHWPRMFESVLAVEHIGHDGTSDRVRFWGTFGDRRGSWVSSREVNPKRMQVRFRQERAAAPLVSFGGLWLVLEKVSGSQVVLDHYYRVADDDATEARRIEDVIARSATAMLDSLRETAEVGEGDVLWYPLPDPVGGGIEGVRLT